MRSVNAPSNRVVVTGIAATTVVAVGVAGTALAGGSGTAATGTAHQAAAPAAAKKSDAAQLPKGRSLPVHRYTVSAGWGHSSGPHAGREHAGIDFAAPTNEPVYAAADGKVVAAGYDGGYGKRVKIRGKDGYFTLYAHLNKYSVKKGQKVRAGQRIGAVGSTGHSTGPHLHFEVRNGKDRAVHPNKYLRVGKAKLGRIAAQLKKRGK